MKPLRTTATFLILSMLEHTPCSFLSLLPFFRPRLLRLEPGRVIRQHLLVRLGLVPVERTIGLVLERVQGVVPQLCSLLVGLRDEYLIHDLRTGSDRSRSRLDLLARTGSYLRVL